MSVDIVVVIWCITTFHVFYWRIQVQIVLATIEGINETYALLISNNTNFAEEDREQIGFSAGLCYTTAS